MKERGGESERKIEAKTEGKDGEKRRREEREGGRKTDD